MFELLTEMVWDQVDLLMISETKLDFSFPNAQFYMKSHSQPYRLDKNSKGGGITIRQGRYPFEINKFFMY